jgi:predicted PurR-regulated permease PerM
MGWAAGVFLVAIGFGFLWLIRNVLFLIFISLLVATGIEPVVNWLRKKGPFSRSTGILTIYLLVFGLLALVLFLAIPPLAQEGQQLVAKFSDPQQLKILIANIDNEFLRNIATSAYENAGSLLQNAQVSAQAVNIGLGIFEVLFSFGTVLVIVFYWLNEKSTLKRFIFSRMDNDRKMYWDTLWDNVEKKLGAWMRGQLLMMLFIGVMAGIGYTIMGVKFAFALAVIAGLTELIPLIGPYIGGAPAVLVALTQSLTLAIIVLVFIVILQLIEGNILVPRVMESAVGVSPLTVIIGILIGTTLGGVGGALIAVPLAAAVQVMINNFLSFSAKTPLSVAATAAGNTGEALTLAADSKKDDNEKEKEQEFVSPIR